MTTEVAKRYTKSVGRVVKALYKAQQGNRVWDLT